MTDVTLPTSRLVLREFTAEDLAAVHAYGSDPQVTRWTVFGPNTENDTREFLRAGPGLPGRAAAADLRPGRYAVR